jgi:KaiC/GvpD/RAD55 family RecA-like ATPase
MFKETINGLDKILHTDIPAGSVVLVTGAPGTLKSGLVFDLISSHLKSESCSGLYITLEQTKESHLRNMECLGLSKPGSLHIFDYKDMREEWKESEPDMIKMTEDVIDYYKEKYNDLNIFALDSLNALYALSNVANLRRNMYYFFSRLRDLGMTSFIIVETPQLGSPVQLEDTSNRPEQFLADGVIELGIKESSDDVKRYIQIRKMRSAKHEMEKHQIIVGKEGISVLGSIY